MTDEQKTTELSIDQAARRRLLKMAGYVPPAILGVMISGHESAHAGITVPPLGSILTCGNITYGRVSAGSNACCPCKQSPTSKNCLRAQCLLGNCTSCGQIPAMKSKDCLLKAATTPCNCTCVKSGKRWILSC